MEYISERNMEEWDEEAEETLSFCDLPLNNSESERSFLSVPCSSSYDDTLFEFSISDLTNYPVENMLFCGKLISPQKSDVNLDSAAWSKRVYKKDTVLRRQGTTNSRWPMLMFGPAKYPVGEKVRRKSVGGSERKIKREKKLWGMIKALGCGGGYLEVA